MQKSAKKKTADSISRLADKDIRRSGRLSQLNQNPGQGTCPRFNVGSIVLASKNILEVHGKQGDDSLLPLDHAKIVQDLAIYFDGETELPNNLKVHQVIKWMFDKYKSTLLSGEDYQLDQDNDPSVYKFRKIVPYNVGDSDGAFPIDFIWKLKKSHKKYYSLFINTINVLVEYTRIDCYWEEISETDQALENMQQNIGEVDREDQKELIKTVKFYNSGIPNKLSREIQQCRSSSIDIRRDMSITQPKNYIEWRIHRWVDKMTRMLEDPSNAYTLSEFIHLNQESEEYPLHAGQLWRIDFAEYDMVHEWINQSLESNYNEWTSIPLYHSYLDDKQPVQMPAFPILLYNCLIAGYFLRNNINNFLNKKVDFEPRSKRRTYS